MILQYRNTRKLESKLPEIPVKKEKKKKRAQYRNIVNPKVPLLVHGRNYERKNKMLKFEV